MDIRKILGEQKEKLDSGAADKGGKSGSEKKVEIAEPEKPEQIPHEEPKLIKESAGQRITDLENQLRRIQAEFENYKKRTDKEREMLRASGSAMMVMQLLPILDEMEVAVNSIHHNAGAKEVKAGMEMLYTKFVSLLNKEGVTEMKALGESFDPYKHEALRTVEGDDEGKVVEVMKKGYLYKGSVLRHAMVVVSRKKDVPGKAEEGKSEEKEEAKEKNEGKEAQK